MPGPMLTFFKNTVYSGPSNRPVLVLLQTWKLRPREVELLAQGHTVRTWYSWALTHDGFPGCLVFQLWGLKTGAQFQTPPMRRT